MTSEIPTPGRLNEFVLDEGLEDDEDVLAFEATNPGPPATPLDGATGFPGAPASAASGARTDTVPERPQLKVAHPNAVVVDGMPADANRLHLEAFLECCGDISSLKIYRFPDKTLAARVEFVEEKAAKSALEKHGAPFIRTSAPVTVAYAPESWDDFIAHHPSKIGTGGTSASDSTRGAIMVGNIPVNVAEILPKPEEVKSAFWSAFASAKRAAEALEQRARAAGTEIDKRLHVTENVEEVTKRSRAAAELVDEQLKVRETLGSAVQAGKEWSSETAKGVKAVDESLGITRRVSEISVNVAAVGAKAAHEVDENLRVSERARDATNSALNNEKIGPVFKRAMSQIEDMRANLSGEADPGTSNGTRRKSYPPRGVEDSIDETNEDSDSRPRNDA